MQRPRQFLLAFWIFVFACGCHSPSGGSAAASAGEARSAEARYGQLSEAFLGWYFEVHPILATQMGVHAHDAALPDWSAAGVAARVAQLQDWRLRFARLDPLELTPDSALDLQLIGHGIEAELLSIERVGPWRRDPRHAISVLTSALASLAEREFAPLEQRLAWMRARMQGLPRILRLAREQLADVPALWVELALRNADGALRFLERDLPGMLQAQGLERVEDPLQAAWQGDRLGLIASFREHRTWLEQELRPRARGDYRLGAELFMEKLRLEEFVQQDADTLWERNERAIQDYQRWVQEVAREIDPERSVSEVMASLTSDHPSPETLLPTARQMLLQCRDFILQEGIVSLPSERLPLVRETPDYARQGFASMSTPGPFEQLAQEAYYNITNVDPSWSATQQSEHLTYFNYPGLLGITVHEAMPGHFVQLLYEQRLPTDVRRIFTTASLVEGWAHYTEQMMVDEGLGAGDPRIRLGQLRRALQRHARWYAGMALHVKGEPFDEVVSRFSEIAFFAPFPALREVQRASYDPTYLYYALGRMQIFELRAELEALASQQGEALDLKRFHDTLLSLGLPLPLARSVMLEAARHE